MTLLICSVVPSNLHILGVPLYSSLRIHLPKIADSEKLPRKSSFRRIKNCLRRPCSCWCCNTERPSSTRISLNPILHVFVLNLNLVNLFLKIVQIEDEAKHQRLSNKQLLIQNIDYAIDLFLIYVLTLSIFPGFLYENTGNHQLGSW